MKIALFSDIHANLPALEAVFADLDAQQPDAVYCLGDLVGYNIWPNEVTDLIRRRGIPTIAGNYDEGIGLHSDNCGCAYKTDADKANGAMSISYTNGMVTDATRHYLKMLPRHLRLSFQLNNNHFDMLLVHGSPRRINEYLFEDRDEASILRIVRDAHARILCFGHTHQPYHRVLTDTDGTTYHAINIGSVGKPKDGDPRACYALLELQDNGELSVGFQRVPYNVEKAAQAVEASPLPNAYATALRNAR
jgi:predicted phosphodiesterase